MEVIPIPREDNSKKRHFESTSPSPPSPPPSPPVEKREWADYRALRSTCAHLNVNISAPRSMDRLVSSGNFSDENEFRSEKSYKESWDNGFMSSFSCDDLPYTRCNEPSMRGEVEPYLKAAQKSNYFDILQKRPHGMIEGFYIIYRNPEDQMDTIFTEHPNFKKFVPLVSRLGEAAVRFHNFLTGSNLRFSDFIKANLLHDHFKQYYFITLEAYDDDDDGKKITCQSRVLCAVEDNELFQYDKELVPPACTVVESFCRVKCSD